MKKILLVNYIMLILNAILLGILFLIIIPKVSNVSKDIWTNYKTCVFEITIYQNEKIYGYATGFSIDSNGQILTNKHVVEVLDSTIFVKIDNVNHEARIKKISEDYDVAILIVDVYFDNYFQFENNYPYVGQRIYTIGNPNGIGLCLQEGFVSAPKKELIIDEKKYIVMQTNLIVNEGNSGGPIINEDGLILGIISFKLRNSSNEVMEGLTFGYFTNEILEFLES